MIMTDTTDTNLFRCADHIRRLTCWTAPAAMLTLQRELRLLDGDRHLSQGADNDCVQDEMR